MVYEWKVSRYKVDAQTAGEELERIGNKQGLTAENIVNESRSKDAVLHCIFEWDDTKAAELHRQNQARFMIGNLTVVKIEQEELSESVRAYVHLESAGNYQPITAIIKSKKLEEEMLEAALKDLAAYRKKHAALLKIINQFGDSNQTKINSLFNVIDSVIDIAMPDDNLSESMAM